MTWSSVKDCFEEYQSCYSETLDSIISDQDTESAIDFELFSCIVVFLRNNVIRNRRKFVSTLNAFAETNETTTLWKIKNIAQLVHWVKADSKLFLQAFNDLWVQWNLKVEALDLFDQIVSEKVWKTRYKKLDRAKQQSDKVSLRIQDKNQELEEKLQVTREITSFDSIYFDKSYAQKISDSSLFTDEVELIWENWYAKIQNKLEINANLFFSE